MAVAYPVVGHWYQRGSRKLFEVVAIDEEDRTIELQHYDGTLEEVDFENWPVALLEEVRAPEDWTGSVDVNPEDVPNEPDGAVHLLWFDPLAEIERDDDGQPELVAPF